LSGSNEVLEFHLGTSNRDEDVIRQRMDANTRASAVGIDEISIADKSDARDALGEIDLAISALANIRSDYGAIQSRLEIAANNLAVQRENVMGARSRIADADIAYEMSELVQAQIQLQAGVAVLAQANQHPQAAIKLL
jgi:flagellin